MKKLFALFFIVSVLGLVAGGTYGWLSANGWQLPLQEYAQKSVSEFQSEVAKSQSEAAQSQLEKTPAEEKSDKSPEDTTSAQVKENKVTNPNKQCSTPGCDNAVFVTYKGKELCVKCYGETKLRELASSK